MRSVGKAKPGVRGQGVVVDQLEQMTPLLDNRSLTAFGMTGSEVGCQRG
jgi:hypothetical protein